MEASPQHLKHLGPWGLGVLISKRAGKSAVIAKLAGGLPQAPDSTTNLEASGTLVAPQYQKQRLLLEHDCRCHHHANCRGSYLEAGPWLLY